MHCALGGHAAADDLAPLAPQTLGRKEGKKHRGEKKTTSQKKMRVGVQGKRSTAAKAAEHRRPPQ